MTTKEAFARGWYDAAMGTGADTARTAGDRYPEYTAEEIDAYLNGVGDGARSDRFRLEA